jgi:predicted  nucleic acid-binding Zn-ribbon protein
MEQEPIEPLRKLLHEQGKVADKIFSIESALNSIRDNLSAAASKQGPSKTRSQDDMGKTFIKEDPTYERLLRALEDMKAQIEERVRPVAEQVVQAEVERLRDLSERQKNALEECLTQIDQSILGCRNHVNAYREKCSDLVMLNQRLANLGAEPVPFPEQIPAADFEDVIRARVEGLHSEGKI